jgi:arylsulfatase A-like enzyme
MEGGKRFETMKKTWVFLLLIAALGTAFGASSTEKPNILFILIDDLGFGDFGCTGNTEVPTPNIDRLASEGTLLTRFHVNSPICSPSRVAFTTGQYPQRWKIHSYLNSRAANKKRDMADFLSPDAPAVARAFKSSGYATAHFGKWHMGGGRDVGDAPLPQAYGFDESLTSFEGLGDRILPPGDLSDQNAKLGRGNITRVLKHEQTGIYVDRAIGFMREHVNTPFYMHLWLNDVHDPFQPAPEDLAKFAGKGRSEEDRKFFAVLSQMDVQLGRLFRAIDDLGLSRRTMIVLTGDNGPTAWARYYKEGILPPGSTAGDRGRKWSLYEGGIRQPMITRWPGRIPAGRVDSSSVVAAIDYFPSITRIAGIKAPNVRFDGQDMSRALLGKGQKRKQPIIWEYRQDIKPGDPRDISPQLAIRDGAWKFLMNQDGSSAELYNLSSDPKESSNLASHEPRRVKAMRKQLENWMRQMEKAQN